MDKNQEIKELKEHISTLKKIVKINKIINSTLDINVLLNIIMKQAANLVKAERSSLYLINPKSKKLEFKIALGDKESKIKRITIKKGEGFVGWCFLHNKPLLVQNVKNDKRWCKKIDEISNFVTKSLICISLQKDGKIIGVLQVLNKLHNMHFQKKDLHLLLDLAEQVQIAINNAKLYENLENLLINTIKSLAIAIDEKDPYTHGHSERVSKISKMIGNEIHLSFTKQKNLELAALLHDIGKIGISEKILNSPNKLTDSEKLKIQSHSLIGSKILSPIKELNKIILDIKYHHEQFNGTGYPKKLKGNKIPLFSRIISISDAFDAMTSDRPYRKALKLEKAIKEIKKESGTHFDPKIVKCFNNIINNKENKNKLLEIIYKT